MAHMCTPKSLRRLHQCILLSGYPNADPEPGGVGTTYCSKLGGVWSSAPWRVFGVQGSMRFELCFRRLTERRTGASHSLFPREERRGLSVEYVHQVSKGPLSYTARLGYGAGG